ncbi:hypothetical protein ACU4GD_09050 [Cupriavidus basilensis]
MIDPAAIAPASAVQTLDERMAQGPWPQPPGSGPRPCRAGRGGSGQFQTPRQAGNRARRGRRQRQR